MKNIKLLRKEVQNNAKINACAARFGVTGDPTRLKICYLLCHYPELAVSEIAEIISAPISTASHSLQKLKAIQVVASRRQAKQVLYSLGQNKFVSLLKSQLILIVLAVVLSYVYFSLSRPIFNFSPKSSLKIQSNSPVSPALAAQFDYLSQNGNSACSAAFKDSIASMDDNARLRGSGCSPMSLHRYTEQIEGLKKFKSPAGQNIAKIPDDPYDIQAGLAKELMSDYDLEMMPAEQAAYDYAMQNSDEKGPCCCKCWRWYVYGGLGKYLIKNHGFTGEQVTEVWDLSDGCGGDSDHHHIT